MQPKYLYPYATLIVLFLAVWTLSTRAETTKGFFGIEIGSPWQSISNQYPNATLSDWYLHMVRHDAPFKVYTIQISSTEFPYVTNADVSVYQDTVTSAVFRFPVSSEKQYLDIKSMVLVGAFLYPPATPNETDEVLEFAFTNFTRAITGTISYDATEHGAQLNVGFDDYSSIEPNWYTEPDIK